MTDAELSRHFERITVQFAGVNERFDDMAQTNQREFHAIAKCFDEMRMFVTTGLGGLKGETKVDLASGLGGLKSEMKADLASGLGSLKGEMKADLASGLGSLKNEMKADLASSLGSLRTEVAGGLHSADKQMTRIEDKLDVALKVRPRRAPRRRGNSK